MPNLTLSLMDKFFEGLVRRIAATSTRRSFLARAGQVGLALVGIRLAPAQPVEQPIPPSPDRDAACSDWQWCGVYGNLCPNCGGTDTSCPHNAFQGSGAWNWNCTDPQGNVINVNYYDCCTTFRPLPSCTPFCMNTTHCYQNNTWCPNIQTIQYLCTLAIHNP